MSVLMPGSKAPDVVLQTAAGEKFSLSKALQSNSLAVLVFYKVSCPVCQFAMPYLERLHRSYPEVPLWGVSQDDSDATTSFAKMYGASFPMILDEHLDSTVQYDLSNVPTTFVIAADGSIIQTISGFVKAELEELNERMAAAANIAVKPLFTEADEVPVLRPG